MKHVFLSIFLMTAVSQDLFSQKIKFESAGIQGGPSLVFTTLDRLHDGNIYRHRGTKFSFHSGIQTDWNITKKFDSEITLTLGQREFKDNSVLFFSDLVTYVSLQFVPKYKITKKLSVGIGMEPTYYFEKTVINRKFDIMIPVKVSYSLFSFANLGLSYKHGLLNLGKNNVIKRKYGDIQFSLYFPLFKSKSERNIKDL